MRASTRLTARALDLLLRRASLLAAGSAARAICLVRLLGGAQRLDGSLDGPLDEIPIESAIGDDRRAVLELDQDARSADLVDV